MSNLSNEVEWALDCLEAEQAKTRQPLVISPSGASGTCPVCGTVYDQHGVDQDDVVPPVGDGCANCS